MKNRYYITFGVDSPTQPYQGGWVVVVAPDINKAVEHYLEVYRGTYAFAYTEDEFKQTSMYTNGNGGKRCHALLFADGDNNEQHSKP